MLEQFLTISRARNLEKKNLEGKFGACGPKSGPKLGFFSFSQASFISFTLNYIW